MNRQTRQSFVTKASELESTNEFESWLMRRGGDQVCDTGKRWSLSIRSESVARRGWLSFLEQGNDVAYRLSAQGNFAASSELALRGNIDDQQRAFHNKERLKIYVQFFADFMTLRWCNESTNERARMIRYSESPFQSTSQQNTRHKILILHHWILSRQFLHCTNVATVASIKFYYIH